MTAYTVEMFSIEKAVASVRRFTNFSASKELPYSLEDAMVFWINKVSPQNTPIVRSVRSMVASDLCGVFLALGKPEDEGACRKRV